ncbi:hypothetical protein [Fortiea contorta]|uniref:hypothetical protein n=1 Tax=Fortiea contorta TaxID=1892405 RepID=UPI0003481D1B|nr:hypothetical protein [Fortiea contorta]
MTQEPRKLINLSVHETADPSVISQNSDREVAKDSHLDDSIHQQENTDDYNSDVVDPKAEENLVNRQMTIASLGGG